MKLAKTQTFCLAQWERFALNRLGESETRPFEVNAVPDELAFEVSAGLMFAGDKEAVKSVFAGCAGGNNVIQEGAREVVGLVGRLQLPNLGGVIVRSEYDQPTVGSNCDRVEITTLYWDGRGWDYIRN